MSAFGKTVRTVLRKEAIDCLRDWRTLASTFAIPLVIMPIASLLIIEVAYLEQARKKSETLRIAITGEAPTELVEELGKRRNLQLHTLPSLPSIDRGWLKSDRYDAALRIESSGEAGKAQVYRDSSSPQSARAAELLKTAVESASDRIRDRRLAEKGLDKAILTPLMASAVELYGGVSDSKRGAVLSGIAALFLMVVVTIAISAYYPAVNITAGEREDGTLRLVLGTGARSSPVMVGKFLVVLSFGILGAISYAIPSLLFAWIHLSKGGLAPATRIDWSLIPQGLLVMVSVAGLISALSLLLGSISRNNKQAQTMLSVLMILSIIPAALLVSDGFVLTAASPWIPYWNVFYLMKAAALGDSVGPGLVTALLVNLAGTATLLGAAIHFLGADKHGEASLTETVARGARYVRLPTPELSVVTLLGVLAGIYYYSMLATGIPGYASVALIQLVLMLGLPYGIARGLKLELTESYALDRPRIRHGSLPAFALLGASLSVLVCWAMAGQKIPDELLRQLASSLPSPQTPLEYVGFLLLVSVLPGFCEELTHRGLILSGLLRRFNPAVAILVGAAGFAVMHFSVLRLAPTFTLGIVLGIVAWRTRSVWPGVLLHASYNASAVGVSALFFVPGPFREATNPALTAAAGLAAPIALFAAGWIAWACARPTQVRSAEAEPSVAA